MGRLPTCAVQCSRFCGRDPQPGRPWSAKGRHSTWFPSLLQHTPMGSRPLGFIGYGAPPSSHPCRAPIGVYSGLGVPAVALSQKDSQDLIAFVSVRLRVCRPESHGGGRYRANFHVGRRLVGDSRFEASGACVRPGGSGKDEPKCVSDASARPQYQRLTSATCGVESSG